MKQYFNLVVLSPPNDIDDSEHIIIIISVGTLTIDDIISVVSPTIVIIMMEVIIPLVLICKWKIRCSSNVYHCSGN